MRSCRTTLAAGAIVAIVLTGPAVVESQEVSAPRPASGRGFECAVDAGWPPTTELPSDLATAVKQYDSATTRNDTTALAALVADDYVLVNSDSSLQDKQSYLADFHLPGFRVHPYVIDEPIQKVWNCAAVTGGLMPLKWTQDGRQHQRLLRVVHVWAKQDGRWRLTFTQLTRVPEDRTAGGVYKRSAPL